MRMWLLLALTVFCFAGPPRALAEGEGESDPTAEAAQRFQRGVSLFREGAYRAALIEFERAYELKPNYRLLYNIAQTELELGDYLGARDAFLRYLQEGVAEIALERRTEVEQKLARLSERVALISVSVNRAGVEVYLDDKLIGRTPLAGATPVNIGRHVVSVRGDDGATASEVVDVAGGDVRKLSFELEVVQKQPQPPAPVAVAVAQPEPVAPVAPAAPALPEEQKRRTRQNKLALGGFAAAGALAVATTITAILQRSAFNSFEAEANKRDSNERAVSSYNDKARRRAALTDVFGGLTLVAAAAGVTFWFLDQKSDDRAGRVRAGFGGSQLLVRKEF